MTDLFAEVNGIKICYEIHGDGYPVLLIHGYGSIKENWMSQIPALSEKFKVINMDNRAAGKSEGPDYPYTMDMFVEDIKGLMDYLKIEKAHVIGWSLGGMIVQNFIIKYPEKIEKMVLINTFPGFPNEQGLNMFAQGLIDGLEDWKKDPAKSFFDGAMGFTRKFKKMMMEDPKRKFHGLFSAEDLIRIKSDNLRSPKDIENTKSAMAKHEVTERLNEVQHPTLLITSDKDRISPKLMMERIHSNMPNSVLKVIVGAGHDSPHERAPEVNQAILEFLEN
jgi:pimeloyl-ACP methyl ester carboxylesterase